MPLRGSDSSDDEADLGMSKQEWWCETCQKDVAVAVHDESFDHEFGTRWLYDFKCVHCERLLHVHEGRLVREREPE